VNVQPQAVTNGSLQPICNAGMAPWIRILSPNGGENYLSGNIINISWQSCNLPSDITLNVRISDMNPAPYGYEINDWAIPITGTQEVFAKSGQFTGLIPKSFYLPGKLNVRLVCVNKGNPVCDDVSDAPFRISPLVKVLSPNGGEQYNLGDTLNIRWEASSGIKNVELAVSQSCPKGSLNCTEYYKGLGFVPNSGLYAWKIPNNVSPGTYYSVTVGDEMGATGTIDTSDKTFSILPQNIGLPPGKINIPSEQVAATQILTRNLTVGSRGSDVATLQNFLKSKGYLVIDSVTQYFGLQTARALARWQAANGISPAVGYLGPLTRAKINSILSQ
jgi:hypothetical protein